MTALGGRGRGMDVGSGLEVKGHWCRGNERGDVPAWLLSGPQVTPVAGEMRGGGFYINHTFSSQA